MHAINQYYYLSTEELLIVLRNYIKNLVTDQEIAIIIEKVFTLCRIDFLTFLTTVKLYKKCRKLRDQFISSYDDLKMQSTLEYLGKNGVKKFDSRINEDVFNYIQRSIKERNRLEKELVKEILDCEFTLLITCTIIASKIYQDISYTNDSWEQVTYISNKKLNIAEKVILEALNYQLFFEGEEKIKREILNTSGKKEIKKGRKSIKGIIKKIFCFVHTDSKNTL
ncbi:hypothetical protein NUSPORA_00471 [Nucleospora cyclopteri]